MDIHIIIQINTSMQYQTLSTFLNGSGGKRKPDKRIRLILRYIITLPFFLFFFYIHVKVKRNFVHTKTYIILYIHIYCTHTI